MPSSFSHGGIRPELRVIVADVAKRDSIVLHPPFRRRDPIRVPDKRDRRKRGRRVSTDGRTSTMHTRQDVQDAMMLRDGSSSHANNSRFNVQCLMSYSEIGVAVKNSGS